MTTPSCAIDICPLGELSDPRAIVGLARTAEASGWDGLSIWDSLGLAMGSIAADPFTTLAAVASATTRLRLISSIIALARRRPQLVVQAAATLDVISEGRLVLGLGAGEDEADFTAFGDHFDRPERIGRMDEALVIVDAGLRGESLDHPGPWYQASGVIGPRPVQQPRPPIWLGAMKPGGIRRAARWEGWIVVAMSEDGTSMALTAAEFASRVEVAEATRHALGRAGEPFDIAVLGVSERTAGNAPATASAFRDAGATWWLESLSPMRGSLDVLEAIVRAGPPR
jgi:alkanesulfonate monooxygenase SsuD/methylene tetrahydromethanopterin reductase-like flavin-dependent oxidoreductase (luciferase family)